MSSEYNFQYLSQEWLRAIRGRRSQRSLSAKLKYKSNVVYRWETGRAHPTASTVLSLMRDSGFDVVGAIQAFYGGDCPWTSRIDPASREGVAHLLDDLREQTPISRLAQDSGFTRYQVTRWLQSANEPRLHEWLTLIHATTHRILDFVSAFFGERCLPSVADDWNRLVATRAAAYEHPESHLILRALELDSYAQLPRHEPGFLAQIVGLTIDQETHSLELLQRADQVEFRAGKWHVSAHQFIDTRNNEEKSRKLRAHWLRLAARAVETGSPGVFGYNLFSISRADYDKAQQLHLRYYREMSELIRASCPNEKVVLFATQLFPLDTPRRQND